MSKLNFTSARVAFLIGLYFSAPKAYGVLAFDAGVGLPQSSIENVDGSMVHYGGVGLLGRSRMDLIEAEHFSLSLDLSGRYLDFVNNANSSAGRETGNHIGFGAGVSLQLGKIVVGGEYSLMKARHFFVGPTRSEYVEFDYTSIDYYAGLRFPLSKALTIAGYYSIGQATLPGADLKLNQDLTMNSNVIWIVISYETNQGVGEFLGKLFE